MNSNEAPFATVGMAAMTKTEEDAFAEGALYLEDLEVGERFDNGTVRVDEAEMKAFASMYDPQPFHLDEAAGEASMFGALAASGWFTAAISMRLLVTSGPRIAGGMIGASGEIAWPRSTHAGDVLTVTTEILEITPSKSRPDRGVVTLRTETRNQDGEAVLTLTAKVMAPRRPA